MTSKPAWQYRRSDGSLHGPFDNESIFSWFGQPEFAQEAKDFEFRNIMDNDIAWMPLTEVLARLKPDSCAVDSDSLSQDDTASALTSHCASGSFTPPSSDEQAGSSQVPTPRENQSLALTAPPSPEYGLKKSISCHDAWHVTLGRVADKVAYRNEGRPGSQHYKNAQKNYICWCLLVKPGELDFAWGPLKLEEVLLATYQNVVVMDTLLAVVDGSVSDYVMTPNTDILKMMAMPFHEHIAAHQQHSPITWSLRQIEEFVGPAAVQRTSTLNAELLDTVHRGNPGQMMHRMNSHGLSSDAFDPSAIVWPGAHLELSSNSHARQRPHSCSQLPPMSVLQHQQARHHGGFPSGMSANRALDDMYLPARAQLGIGASASRARSNPRAPVVHGLHEWQGKKFIVDEATRERIKNTLVEMIKVSEIPPVDNRLPPALANPPPTQNMHKQMPSLTMPIPEHISHQMQQMPIPVSSTFHSSSRPLSAPNSLSNDLLALTSVPARSRGNSRPASYSQIPQEFNIHAADFTPTHESGNMMSAPDMHSAMDSRVHADMDRIASSFSGQLKMENHNVSNHGCMNQGLFTHPDAAPMRQTDPGSMHAHNLLSGDPAALASAAAAVLNTEQLNSVLAQMASSMNCSTAQVQDLLHSLTEAARLQCANVDTHSTTGSNLPDVNRVMTSQSMTNQPAVSGSVSQWSSAPDLGSHLLGDLPMKHSSGQSLLQTHLPPHLQPFSSEFPRQPSVQVPSLGGSSDSLATFGGFGGGHTSSFGAGGLSGGLGAGSGRFGSGNLGGNLSDALGRGHSLGHGLGHSGGFNDSLQCVDLGLGQM